MPTFNRREFLAMSGSAVLLATTSACGGGGSGGEEKSIAVERLFRLNLRWGDPVSLDGPFTAGRFRRVVEGTFEGKEISGKLHNLASTDWGWVSQDGKIKHIEGHLTLQTADGSTILLQIRGRRSPRYGGNSRLQIIIYSPLGKYEYLGERTAIGFGNINGDSETIDVYAIDHADPASVASNPDWRILKTELVLHRDSTHNVNEMPYIQGRFGGRFVSIATEGVFDLPDGTKGNYPNGYAFTPHRVSTDATFWHHDVKSMVVAEDGTPIQINYAAVQDYRRVVPDKSWRNVGLFEVPAGKHAWLNEVVAIGIGSTSAGGGGLYYWYAVG